MDPSQVRVTQDTSPAGQKDREQSKGLCTPSISLQVRCLVSSVSQCLEKGITKLGNVGVPGTAKS